MQQQQQQEAPHSGNKQSQYFQLMENVGTYGKYQFISMIVWSILWLSTGTILLGTPFFMYNPPYVCSQSQNSTLAELSSEQCQNYVCSLPPSERLQFQDKNSFSTVSNNFIDLHCQKAWITDLVSSIVYLGCFFGYISISIMVDNVGRKKAMLISYGIATVGMIVAALATNIYLVGVGFFLMGFGSDSAINICFYFITETMEDKHRQKYCILVQVFFCLGGIVNVGYFFIFKNWRIIMWVFLVAPSVISIFIIFKVIKDTPYFLIKRKSKEIVLSELNSIHVINNGTSLSEQKQNQLRNMIQNLQKLQLGTVQSPRDGQQQNKPTHRVYTPLDLFRYKSIRFISIAVCLLSTLIYILYYGPLMLISKLSFNLYINALVVTASQLITYPFSYFFIHKIKRKLISIVLFGICAASSFALIFVIGNLCTSNQSSNCQALKVVQLVFIFIFRFCSSLEFALFLVYCNQVFPTQIRGMGIGISSALGTVASTSSPYIFGSHLKSNIETSRIMIVFVVLSIVGVGLWIKLPQTLNCKIVDEIKQIAESQSNQANKGEGHIQLVQIKQSD